MGMGLLVRGGGLTTPPGAVDDTPAADAAAAEGGNTLDPFMDNRRLSGRKNQRKNRVQDGKYKFQQRSLQGGMGIIANANDSQLITARTMKK